MIYWTVAIVKTVYHEWKAAIPIAITAFKAGYADADIPVAIPTKPKTESQRLREACTRKGIRWRNLNGKNRHATIKQMQAMLAHRHQSNQSALNLHINPLVRSPDPTGKS
jgi:hypothetical protein